MAIVTLIGENLAKKGLEFTYLGPIPECRDCKVRNVCFSLDVGRKYRIASLRDTFHECKRHEGKVRAVEVEKMPVEAAMPAKMCVEGTTVRYETTECRNMACRYYDICHPLGVKKGAKYRILKIKGDVKCPEGNAMKSVLLE